MTHSELIKLLTTQRVEDVAPLILGSILIKDQHFVQIVEVEAYAGADDPGSHAFRRKSPKNATMFDSPGLSYVYFTYGNHWMLNLVAHKVYEPAAILIRAAKPLSSTEELYKNRPVAKTDRDLLSGPGKLTAALNINSKHNGIMLMDPKSPIHLIPPKQPRPYYITTRIGIAVGKGENTPWRFVDEEESQWASHPNRRY